MWPTIFILLLVPPAIFSSMPGFPYGKEKIRGVNLGGWLVLEPWITPSLFDDTGDPRIIDEYTFSQFQDRAKARRVLKHHWDTWITETDFKAIAAAGLNHVRIPIGYWAWDVSGGEPFIQGQLPYLTLAIRWAAKYGLKVMIDLHGAPGSQNGFDNSGQKLPFPTWQTKQYNIDRTNAIIKKLANAYKRSSSVVTAIAVLNEPAGFRSRDILETITQYWYDSYGNIRFPFGTEEQSNTVLVIHDAFQPLSYWKGYMSRPKWTGVMLDTHRYQIFSPADNHKLHEEHIRDACAQAEALANFSLWVVVGEWTPAPNDCAKYLNGRHVGSRYEGTYPGSSRVGSCSGKTGNATTFGPAYKTFLRQYWEAQATAYEKGEGWIQWTWKTEHADEWSYQAGLANGWIPQNPSVRSYPRICG